jgi:hypothetical protein
MRHFAVATRRLSSALSIALAVMALLVAGPGSVAARDSKTTSPTGYDISYPQCGGPLPANPAFGIVGVNAGIVYSPNPCLGTGDGPSELAWAGGASAQLYANTGNPGPALSSHWPNGQTSPRACNTATAPGPDTADCVYDYGWNAAADSYQTAIRAYVSLGLAQPGAARPVLERGGVRANRRRDRVAPRLHTALGRSRRSKRPTRHGPIAAGVD